MGYCILEKMMDADTNSSTVWQKTIIRRKQNETKQNKNEEKKKMKKKQKKKKIIRDFIQRLRCSRGNMAGYVRRLE